MEVHVLHSYSYSRIIVLHRIGIVAYSPLGRGFFSSGSKLVESLSEGDFRKYLPRFQRENLKQNQTVFELVSKMAARKRCTASQLALAWGASSGTGCLPHYITETTNKIENLKSNIDALSVSLTAEEMAELEALALIETVKGDNYSFGMPTWKTSDMPLLFSWKA